MDGPSRGSPQGSARFAPARFAPDLARAGLGLLVLVAVILAGLAGVPPYALAFAAAAGIGLLLWGLFPRRPRD